MTHRMIGRLGLHWRGHSGEFSTVRAYRKQLTSTGQASPPHIAKMVSCLLQLQFSNMYPNAQRRYSILDIGCGLGVQMSSIVQSSPNLFSSVCGIDWSPATVEHHNSDAASVYHEVRLGDSAVLPFKDGEFDIALSMENLEHLYDDTALASLAEMKRVARYLVITTPLPHKCINFNWIYPEIVEAINDPIPLSQRDFVCLESAIHKSTIFPQTMVEAGFTVHSNQHGIYFGESEKLKLERVQTLGISPVPAGPEDDYKWRYVSTLAQSAQLHEQIVAHPLYRPPSGNP